MEHNSPSSSVIQTGSKEIDKLLTMIITSTQDALAEYKKSGAGLPSPHATEAHPLDSASDEFALKRALRILEGACETLCTTLAQPMHTILNRSMPFEAQCMRLIVENRIADLLEKFPNGLHVAEIASKTKNQMNPRKLGQVMGLLAARGCFREVSENTFTNNRLSLTLVSTNPVASMVHLCSYEIQKSINVLPEAMTDPEYAITESAEKSAYTFAVRDEGATSFYGWYQKHPELQGQFDHAMIGLSRVEGSLSIVNNYPWSDLPQGTTFCDVGSGVGTIPLALAKAHPNLRIILQDLPGAIEEAKQLWKTEFPEAIETGKVTFKAFDFFAESPMEDQDFYYMKHIMHNSPDAEAIKILKNIAAVMKPSSCVLIHEIVMMDGVRSAEDQESQATSMAKAQEPLLPNYGSGNLRHHNQNLNMLGLFNARQRTRGQFRALGESAGLELVEVLDLVEMHVLKFQKINVGA
ncbi:hypothetical protein D9758_010955 [Tetrapyrgos nigripes]|uniref:O-methyltransferase C-terminal domain-containing protein n=1 Tax=Tetrapyrgos nigripes TaxID=182062 RepID=A0A8H5LPS9_9AGAR|nr:hypothetical protein D9758_010955 [Tetrapyrgos nigripes]